jgi:hypothetical protein
MAKGLKEIEAVLAKAKDEYMMDYNHQRKPVMVLILQGTL